MRRAARTVVSTERIPHRAAASHRSTHGMIKGTSWISLLSAARWVAITAAPAATARMVAATTVSSDSAAAIRRIWALVAPLSWSAAYSRRRPAAAMISVFTTASSA